MQLKPHSVSFLSLLVHRKAVKVNRCAKCSLKTRSKTFHIQASTDDTPAASQSANAT